MVRARLRLGALLAGILLASPAHAIPYWFAWEGNDFPENQGWQRNVLGQPDVRTLADGIMTLDGLNTTGGWDAYERFPVGTLHVDLGETFVMQWRLRVDGILRSEFDPIVYVVSDDGWTVALHYGTSRVLFSYESAYVGFPSGEFHEYEFRSEDMRTYGFYVDGLLRRTGFFAPISAQSWIGWGDGHYPTRSRSSWDYFRYGVVPEPPGVVAAVMLGMTTARVRHRRL